MATRHFVKGLPATAGLFFFLVIVLMTSCSRAPRVNELSGLTMGTAYSIQISGDIDSEFMLSLQQAIDGELFRLDKTVFSTWSTESEVSRFNHLGLHETMQVSVDLQEVLAMAQQIGSASDGAFDITVAPLVALWGFGPGHAGPVVPDEAQVHLLQQQTGLNAVMLGPDGSVRKSKPRQLDFSGIAKGYAVDRIGAILQQAGLDHFIVEIGGEVLVCGEKAPGMPWRVAIEQPDTGPREAAGSISFNGRCLAVAGSGSYRQFFDYGGRRYSHEIDPRSGYPANNALVSVVVVNESAAVADAWATAFMVLGPEKSLALADKHAIPLFYLAEEGGKLVSDYNVHFAPWLEP